MFKLDKPCTLQQRTDFIHEYEQIQGLIIQETPEALIALDKKVEEPTLADIRTSKLDENEAMYVKNRYYSTFTLTIQGKICEFKTDIETQLDLLTAYAITSSGYIYGGYLTENEIELNLKLEDVITILAKFVQVSNVGPIWLTYKQLINKADNIETLKNLNIDYKLNV